MAMSFIVITVVIVLLLSYYFFCEDRFVVRRNAVINLPIDTIAQDLSDLNQWPHWIPWLIYEPNAKVDFNYSNTGNNAVLPSYLEWQGELVKNGYISIIPARSNVHYCHAIIEVEAFFPGELHFNIDLSKQGSHTLVSIQITGDIPFLKRWQAACYLVRATRDLELSIIRLTAHLARYNQSDHYQYDNPTFRALTQTKLKHFDAVTRPFTVRDQPMSQKMEQGFHDLLTLLGPNNPPAGPSFAIYTKADPVHHYFSGKLGISTQNLEPCDSRPERITLDGNYLTILYGGNYQNLSLAWHIAHNLRRLHNLRFDRKRPGVEIFENGPCDTSDSKDYVTKICLPIK
ncbi:AraC family transcriptional regulator [Marinomonas sp. TI.3.20]|uniref:AraC family transcriptional regulator n=1 Tax=Marinomonas sp. TI.3.20 TaxID=3121296 RepID=UPI00311E238F